MKTKKYRIGDSIQIQQKEKFDSIIVYTADGSRLIHLNIDQDKFQLGFNTIRIKAFTNGKDLDRKFRIKVLSNLPTEKITPDLIQTYPHNAKYFTQGFQYSDGFIYESSGLYKKSFVTKYTLEDTKNIQQYKLDKKYFAEGLTIVDNLIYVLTWQSRKVLVLDTDLNFIRTLDLPTEIDEGWGITYNDGYFYVTNGSAKIFKLNKDFEIITNVQVAGYDKIYNNLNELEFHNGHIYANVWQQDIILEINPASGRVDRIFDMQSLVQSQDLKGADVLNGTTFLPNGNLLVTGKNWDALYETSLP